jgi:hypothetical protein
MNCENCQTTLPDEAIACWKCGAPVAASVALAPSKKDETDLLFVIITFVISVAFFVCAGWSVPFTIWGLVTNSTKEIPPLSELGGILSGLAFIVAAVAVFGGSWWGSYWLLKRISRPT